MAAKKVRILGVHGLGHQEINWFEGWKAAIRLIYPDPETIEVEFLPCYYDPIFRDVDLSLGETLGAVAKLGWSGVTHLFRRERGLLGKIDDTVRWTAGYVVAWVDDKEFQQKTRKLFLDLVADFKPDIILAHSLGSLVTYNAIGHDDAKAAVVASVLKKAQYVTFGSQVGNPFVIGSLSNGRVRALPVARWWHLFNKYDPVFTAAISLPGAANFTQVLTPFNDGGLQNHNSVGYLHHGQAIAQFWGPYAAATTGGKVFGFGRSAPPKSTRAAKATMRRRALLVGINDYIDPANRLEGCVNDVFAMSAVLQECGFAPEEIRTCLDRRATAAGLLERMAWLVDDVRPGDERVFFYSGHGAQMPVYGPTDEPDRLVETLVPCDFDWSPETAITDEHIYGLYSQLPYDTRLAMIFDCCHSGGVHRQGGSRARGITPPDDIRHRQLKWDLKTQMWVGREFRRINPDFSTANKANVDFFGKSGAKLRLGRAGVLRAQTPQAGYRRAKQDEGGPVGPYLPLIIEACGEDQLSYEYRHGATSYGAFTFCLASLLRENQRSTFAEVVAAAKDRLVELQYGQTPQILGPTQVVNARVPWRTGITRGGAPPTGRPGGSTPRLSG
ncbi:hypothetical protein BH10PSE3_BH10PSE3_09330 [soil metagenome]